MLENVYFVITKSRENDDSSLEFIGKIDSAVSYLSKCGVTTKRINDGNIDELLKNCSKENSLFLADSYELIKALWDQGCYAIGVISSTNAACNFPGVLYVFTDIDEVDMDSYVKAYQRLAGLPWSVLETKRCLIRETVVEDVDSFYKIYAEPSIARFTEGLFENPEDERSYTRDYIEKVYGLMGFGVWTVIDKESGEIIGKAGFSIRNGFDNVELGFIIAVPFQGKGYATEVCKGIIEFGQRELGFNRIIAFVKKDNLASVHILENKLNFAREDEVTLEEDIYGGTYHSGRSVTFSPAHFGQYLEMVWTKPQ